jgi:glycosyltransferase involved in cell wall biosynthesis
MIRNKVDSELSKIGINNHVGLFSLEKVLPIRVSSMLNKRHKAQNHEKKLGEVFFITSYPPRECGIATYSQDLIKTLNTKFSKTFSISVCALEPESLKLDYPREVKYILNTSVENGFEQLANTINANDLIRIVVIQHEFGFFRKQENSFQQFLTAVKKPTCVVFHTVLPHPDKMLRQSIYSISQACESIVVMTKTSAEILTKVYDIPREMITIIPHGTHLVEHTNRDILKTIHGFTGRKILTTFGLLSAGKSIETTLNAMPAIIKQCPEVLFLVIGKTHPEVVKAEGEIYRIGLEQKVKDLGIQNHVKFINSYLSLPELLDYLQLTDIYLFTSNDPNQAVSGTFVYAMSCACPIISTPIPHAKEILTKDVGILFDFQNHRKLAEAVIKLVNDEALRINISINTMQKIVSTAWENSAVAHSLLFEKMTKGITLEYNLPDIKLDHIRHMTTNTGIIQFCKTNMPDIGSGYTLDDNARALIALAMYYEETNEETCLSEINKYLVFIHLCQQPNGDFLNYVDKRHQFTTQNQEVNLDDSNGRAVWALGYILSLKGVLPSSITLEAESMLSRALPHLSSIHSTRAMAFCIKGLWYAHKKQPQPEKLKLIRLFANRLYHMFKHESSPKWEWYECYLTYANSILPEAMLYAWLATGDLLFRNTAIDSLRFLLLQTFGENGIEVISNRKWLKKGEKAERFGEQPIDVAYTIMTLSAFYDVFKDEDYHLKMQTGFNWFLGQNHLHEIIYNPCTGGCYDGLEDTHVNLNQGAESTVSYLMARLTMGKHRASSN